MITFNELRIDNENKRIIIDAFVNQTLYEEGLIDSIQLYYYTNIGADGIPINPELVYELEFAPANAIRLTLPLNEIAPTMKIGSLELGLFYINIHGEYNIDEETVYIDNEWAVIPDWEAVYGTAMPFISNLAIKGFDECNFPVVFEEFALLWYGLQIAISVCDFNSINAMWERFIRMFVGKPSTSSPCDCNK